MRKIISILLILVISISGMHGQEIKQKEFDVKHYNEIKVCNAFQVNLIVGDREGVVVKCDEKLMPAIKVKQNGQNIIIGFDSDKLDEIAGTNWFKSRSITFTKDKIKINDKVFEGGIKVMAYAREVKGISALSSAYVLVQGNISTDELQIEASSSGNIVLEDVIKANNLDVICSSSGDVQGNLIAKIASMKINSSGDFTGDIKADKVYVNISSSGDYKGNINADKAKFNISSSGDAKVEGNINDLYVKASSSSDFFGKGILYKTANVETNSLANIYLSKSGKLIYNSLQNNGIKVE